ncbi:MAG: DUF3800 domain-containing protein [Patescibacteria group bacterium]|nr:DUF3800 domain-containing protein [Patescibacteria group bacterium]
MTQKLYCYVDETGQDTKGEIFIVSIVVTKDNRYEIEKLLEKIETETGKLKTKWSKSKRELQSAYIERVFDTVVFKNSIFYSLTKNSKTYKDTMLVTIATAVNMVKTKEKTKASVFIDGLERKEILMVKTGLRRIGLNTEKVRGIKDESNAIIRLADAIAGLVRKKVKGAPYAEKLYLIGIKKEVLRPL